MLRRTFVAALAGAALLGSATAGAQDYPTKTVTVIVPFAAGGPTDALARILVRKMQDLLGQSIVVENVGGAGGTIGVAKAARARPDGYTLVFGHVGTQAVNAALYKDPQYNPETDFEAIGIGGINPLVLVVKKDLAAKNFSEFLALVRQNQAKMSNGTAGIGAASHLGAIMFNHLAKVEVEQIPYKGTGPAMNDLVAGQIDYMFDQGINVIPQMKSGSIRGLAVSTKSRLATLPDMPTMDEGGLKGFDLSIWNAFFAPKGTPQPIIAKVNKALMDTLADAEVKKRLTELEVVVPNADELKPAYLKSLVSLELKRWKEIVVAAKIQPQ